MILTDAAKTYSAIPVYTGGDNWSTIFACQYNGPVAMGDRFLVTGRLQAHCREAFAIEFCASIHATPDLTPALVLDSPPGRILPVVGANVHPEVGDKYLVAHETALWAAPVDCSYVYFALRARARSTQAVSSTRLALANGSLQVTRL